MVRAQELLTKHKLMVATFLEASYARFFDAYTKLLNSENYVTKRQALKACYCSHTVQCAGL